MDKKGNRLLYELDKNGRAPYSQLAKRVGLSQESVRYRVNRLVEDKVILKFQTVINGPKIGINYYKVFFKLRGLAPEIKIKIVEFLSKDKNVSWLGFVDGQYNLGVTLAVSNPNQITEFLDRFEINFPNIIQEKSISMNSSGTYFNRDYFLYEDITTNRKSYAYGLESEKEKTDKKDLGILKLLCQDARKSTVEMASILGISHDSVYNRIKNMENRGIITSYSIVLNSEILSQLNYKILVHLNNYSLLDQTKLFNYLKRNPRLTYWVKAIGNWDIDFELEVSSVQEMRETMNDLSSKFNDLIKDCTVLTIYDFKMYTFLPQNFQF